MTSTSYGPIGAEFLVNSTTTGAQVVPVITGLADGGFVVTWQDDSHQGGDTGGYAIKGRIFSASGEPSGPEFLINTTVSSDQYSPSVSAMQDGGFVVS